MKNLAPHLTRQRLLIEALYSIEVDQPLIENYFSRLTKSLGLKAYSKPIIFSPGGEGKEVNQGYDAFIPLIDSEISLYVWTSTKFLSVVIYTCKAFDVPIALKVTQEFFKAKTVEHMSF